MVASASRPVHGSFMGARSAADRLGFTVSPGAMAASLAAAACLAVTVPGLTFTPSGKGPTNSNPASMSTFVECESTSYRAGAEFVLPWPTVRALTPSIREAVAVPIKSSGNAVSAGAPVANACPSRDAASASAARVRSRSSSRRGTGSPSLRAFRIRHARIFQQVTSSGPLSRTPLLTLTAVMWNRRCRSPIPQGDRVQDRRRVAAGVRHDLEEQCGCGDHLAGIDPEGELRLAALVKIAEHGGGRSGRDVGDARRGDDDQSGPSPASGAADPDEVAGLRCGRPPGVAAQAAGHDALAFRAFWIRVKSTHPTPRTFRRSPRQTRGIARAPRIRDTARLPARVSPRVR